jgi:CTP synthase (UTP-ammonia lyase)
MKDLRIGIVGDYDPTYISHDATGAALEASGQRLGLEVNWEWVATEAIAANASSASSGMMGCGRRRGVPTAA